MDFDATDRWLLELLQEDDRRSYAELGAIVGLSISGVNARIRKLVANGVIERFAAQLNPAAVDLDLLAFIHIVLERPEHDGPFVQLVIETPEILECHHVTGDFSYLLKVRVRNTGALEQLITDKIKRLPGVVRSQTVIALSSPKESTALAVRPRPTSEGAT